MSEERMRCPGAGAYPADSLGSVPGAAVRASLGCGNPLEVAAIAPGETVLDLGSGGGLDVLLSARRTGPEGRVYGLDADPEKIALAVANAREAQAGNVEFLEGRIQDIPLPDRHVDVVISNCVINLSAGKRAVLAEAFRVLRPGGRLAVTDVISSGGARAARGDECAAGAEYRHRLLDAGFTTASIEVTQPVADGLRSAIVRAAKPAAPSDVEIRPMRDADAAQVLAIYQAGLDTGDAGFETAAPPWDAFDAAMLPRHRHVAVDTTSGEVLGWVAVSLVSSRCVYAGMVEHAVYVSPGAHGRGIGSALLTALAASTETDGVWTIQSGVFPENAAALAVHERAGFRVVGTRRKLGRQQDRWRDVVLLERRSTTAGTEPGSPWDAR